MQRISNRNNVEAVLDAWLLAQNGSEPKYISCIRRHVPAAGFSPRRSGTKGCSHGFMQPAQLVTCGTARVNVYVQPSLCPDYTRLAGQDLFPSARPLLGRLFARSAPCQGVTTEMGILDQLGLLGDLQRP